jgi:hypothetical protein
VIEQLKLHHMFVLAVREIGGHVRASDGRTGGPSLGTAALEPTVEIKDLTPAAC